MSSVSTHVLDLVRGGPAVGVAIRLEHQDPETGRFSLLTSGETNADGRIPDLLPRGGDALGIFRIHFATGAWYAQRGERCFYPEVSITFEIPKPGEHYHVPLLIGPYGYSTYRGS
jgi:5-hydroxyisourate hydrolase